MEFLRNFCFTLYDSDAETVAKFAADYCSYLIYGNEICPDTQRKHMQGYAELKKQTRFTTIKKIFSTIHVEKRIGSASQAADYCKKDQDFLEFGSISRQGKRTDLDDVSDAIVEKKVSKRNCCRISYYFY